MKDWQSRLYLIKMKPRSHLSLTSLKKIKDSCSIKDQEKESFGEAIIYAAKDAVIAIDMDYKIVIFNPAAEVIFRCRASEVLGSLIDRFIPLKARKKHEEHLHHYRKKNDAVREMGKDRVLMGLRADGEEFPVDATISQIEYQGERRFIVFLRDITERVRNSEALRHYSDIVESSHELIISFSLTNKILTCNKASYDLLGYSHDQLIKKKIQNLIIPTTRESASETIKRALAGKGVVNEPILLKRRNREKINVLMTISLILNRDEKVVGASAIFYDIRDRLKIEIELRKSINKQKRTEQKLIKSRDNLRQLSSSLQSIREEEKTRIARELHDELGQSLTALKMDASAIASHPKMAYKTLVKKAQDMRMLIDSTVTSVRRISADLRPIMLDKLGLAPTLEWLMGDFFSRTGVKTRLSINENEVYISGEIATAIFRIVQESLTNVARHAKATLVEVSLKNTKTKVLLKIVDNGQGLSSTSQKKKNSFGLIGMRERVYVLGGEFLIQSIRGSGTVIIVRLPNPIVS